MPLEATIIVIDNSEYMRNGDYHPTRFEAQRDAVNTVFQTKTDSNPENVVGLMTMAGKGPEVLVTNAKDLGRILKGLHEASSKIGGAADIPTALSVAQLALKHRQSGNLRQRIVVFIGSPLEGQAADEKNMVRLAKKLKKNNVAVDFVAFGDGIEEGENSILKAFVENVNSGDNSHLLSVPPGPHLLSDVVLNSPVLAGDRGIPEEALGGAGASGSGAAAGNNFEFGVDPSIDPELAMALRMSMEEEQARQAAAAQAAQATSEGAGTAGAPTSSETVPAGAIDDENAALLQQAMAMSEGRDVEMAHQPAEGDEDMDEDEAIQRAIAMSMQQPDQEGESKDKK